MVVKNTEVCGILAGSGWLTELGTGRSGDTWVKGWKEHKARLG